MERYITSDGLQLSYAIDDYTDPWRKAETVILLHAAMGSSVRYYAWVPHLARNFRVVRLDLRGHGESAPAASGPLTFERLCLDVIELMDHLGVATAHVAGSSAGAFIAQNLAVHWADRIATLASYAATPGMKMGKQDYSGWVTRIRNEGVTSFLRNTIADRIDVNQVPPGFVEWFTNEAGRTNVDTLVRFVPLMATVDLREDIKAIRCPTLVVVPGGDPFHTVDEYRIMPDSIPDCEFVVYDGLPHNITDAAPDRCAQDLNRFLLAVAAR
jgi:3-oxoadipate enol-lactonase